MSRKKKDKSNSYGTRVEYKDVLFKSKFEADFAEYLDTLGLEWQYEPDSFSYTPPVSKYTPDFKVWKPGEKKDSFFIETKGRFTLADRQKMKQIKKQYPKLNIKMLFQRPTIKLGKKMTYKSWCEKYEYETITMDSLKNLVEESKQSE